MRDLDSLCGISTSPMCFIGPLSHVHVVQAVKSLVDLNHFREIVWRRAHVWRRRGLGGLAVRQSYPGHPRKHSRRWPRRRYSVYLLYWYKITGTNLLNTDAPDAVGGGLVVGTQFRCLFPGTKLQILTQKALQAALRTLISTGHSIREI